MKILPLLMLVEVGAVLWVYSMATAKPETSTPPTAPPTSPPLPQPPVGRPDVLIPGELWGNECLYQVAAIFAGEATEGSNELGHAIAWAKKRDYSELAECLQTEPGSEACQSLFTNALYIEWSQMSPEQAADKADKLEAQGYPDAAECFRATWKDQP